jgi:drug/metabolite transporter (DMT)-like permease
MKAPDAARLTALAAIWGSSFLFTRVAAPAIGPVATADLRMLIGGVALAAWLAFTRFDAQWRRWWHFYVLVGLLTSAVPFLLFGYAALELTAGMLVVLNATSPMWGALLAALFEGARLSISGTAGLALGVGGVALLAAPEGGSSLLSITAALGGAFSYGVSAVVMRRWTREAPARGLAVGTQVTGGLLFLPLMMLSPPAMPGAPVILSVLALGLLCSAAAYLLYFRLIADIGAAGALTVTYLIPVFGILWGALFLGEPLHATMLGGAALVIAGTILVLRG